MRRAAWDSGYSGDDHRRRNIVLSYMRDGMQEGNAVRCADQLLTAMETWRVDIEQRKSPPPPEDRP